MQQTTSRIRLHRIVFSVACVLIVMTDAADAKSSITTCGCGFVNANGSHTWGQVAALDQPNDGNNKTFGLFDEYNNKENKEGIKEPYSSITSLLMSVLGVVGILSDPASDVPVLSLLWGTLIMNGIGSAVFHAYGTLFGALLDSFSMTMLVSYGIVFKIHILLRKQPSSRNVQDTCKWFRDCINNCIQAKYSKSVSEIIGACVGMSLVVIAACDAVASSLPDCAEGAETLNDAYTLGFGFMFAMILVVTLIECLHVIYCTKDPISNTDDAEAEKQLAYIGIVAVIKAVVAVVFRFVPGPFVFHSLWHLFVGWSAYLLISHAYGEWIRSQPTLDVSLESFCGRKTMVFLPIVRAKLKTTACNQQTNDPN